MKFKGKAWKFGKDIDTDQIIPARYLNTSDPKELARHCMEDADPEFVNKMKAGDIIVADKNFGCGSSREHAPISIKAAGISCVIAKSFARIFYRNSFNMGLPILECPEAVDAINEGDEIDVDLDKGEIIVNPKSSKYKFSLGTKYLRKKGTNEIFVWTEHLVGRKDMEEYEPKVFKAQPIPPFMQELINTGGLMEWVKKTAVRG